MAELLQRDLGRRPDERVRDPPAGRARGGGGRLPPAGRRRQRPRRARREGFARAIPLDEAPSRGRQGGDRGARQAAAGRSAPNSAPGTSAPTTLLRRSTAQARLSRPDARRGVGPDKRPGRAPPLQSARRGPIPCAWPRTASHRLGLLAFAVCIVLASFAFSAARSEAEARRRADADLRPRCHRLRDQAQRRRPVAGRRRHRLRHDRLGGEVLQQPRLPGRLRGSTESAKSSDSRSPFAYGSGGLDTTKLANGRHTLTATAYAKGSRPASATISVTVSNVAPTPAPSPTPPPAPAPTPAPAPCRLRNRPPRRPRNRRPRRNRPQLRARPDPRGLLDLLGRLDRQAADRRPRRPGT